MHVFEKNIVERLKFYNQAINQMTSGICEFDAFIDLFKNKHRQNTLDFIFDSRKRTAEI